MTTEDRETLIRINLSYLIEDTIYLLKEMKSGKFVSTALLNKNTNGIIILKELIGGKRNESESKKRRKCSKNCNGKGK